MANYKNDQDSNITPEEWELVNEIILQLAPFFVTKNRFKNNAFALSVISHAKSLIQFAR